MNEETKEILMNKTNMRYAVHMIITALVAAGIAWFSNEIILNSAWNKIYIIFTTMLCVVIGICSFLERKNLYTSIRTMGILIVCFLLSGLLLLLSDYYINLPIWVLGGIVVAALVSRNVGMLYLYYFVFHAIYLQGNWMNGLVFHFAVASLIAFFIPKMKTFLSMLYMMAFAACIIVTGSVIHNQMGIDAGMLIDTFYILCTYLVCIVITMFLVRWNTEQNNEEEAAEEMSLVPDNYAYLEKLAMDTAQKDAEVEAAVAEFTAQKEKQEPEAEVSEETLEEPEAEVSEDASEEPVIIETEAEEEEEAETVPKEDEVADAETEVIREENEIAETETEEIIEETTEEISATEEVQEEIPEETIIIDYTPYCDERAELLQELRMKDKASYARAILVGKLAAQTAMVLGLNTELTKAGGLYRVIGKIRENNNEYTATEIAKEHNFPEPLIYLLDQLNHNIVEQKEAALILITDGVLSQYSAVRGTQKDIPVEKIVDTIISKKIFQGEFNESGLNVQEFFTLREYLVALLKEQDKKSAAKAAERSKTV